MQGGSVWTKPKESKKGKQPEGSKHSSSSSGQPQKQFGSIRASGNSTQPSMFSNLSISHPTGPIHQNAPSHLTLRAWTIQRWTPGIWNKQPWENWTTAPTLATIEHEFTMRTISMEEELGYGHHRPSRPELAAADQPSYIDRNLLVSKPLVPIGVSFILARCPLTLKSMIKTHANMFQWAEANELNFNSLLKLGKWTILTSSNECFKATDNLNDAAIKLIKYLEIDLE